MCFLLDADWAGTTTSHFNKRYINWKALLPSFVEQSKPEVTLCDSLKVGCPAFKMHWWEDTCKPGRERDDEQLSQSHIKNLWWNTFNKFLSLYTLLVSKFVPSKMMKLKCTVSCSSSSAGLLTQKGRLAMIEEGDSSITDDTLLPLKAAPTPPHICLILL